MRSSALDNHRSNIEHIYTIIDGEVGVYLREAQSDATTTVHAPDAELHIPALPRALFVMCIVSNYMRHLNKVLFVNCSYIGFVFTHRPPKRAARKPRTTVVQRPTRGETPATTVHHTNIIIICVDEYNMR